MKRTSLYSLSEVEKKIVVVQQSLQESLEREGKKGSGSYYTPNFIVDYIVNTSLSKTIVDRINRQQNKFEFKNLDEVINIKDSQLMTLLFQKILPNFLICDLAMGWGVFLLHAFDFLLSFYLSFDSFISEYTQKTLKVDTTVEEWIVTNILSNSNKFI